MTFGDLKRMLAQDVNRSDKEAVEYPLWINRGLRKIQSDENFACMSRRLDVRINAGESSAALPEDFKELKVEGSRSPVARFHESSGFEEPWDVVTREYALRHPHRAMWLGFDGASGLWTVNVPPTETGGVVFRLNYYEFLPDLIGDGESNYLTVNYPELVEARIKAIAFAALADPIAVSFEQLAVTRLREAKADDHRRATRGRVFRMGG